MAAPTTRFREFPIASATTLLDTAAERLAAVSGESSVSTGTGNEVDFGTLNISSAAQQSAVKLVAWDVTADGSNTSVSAFKLWQSSEGFDVADEASDALGTPWATTSANPTITFASAHGFAVGDTITFSGTTSLVPSDVLDGVHTVATVPSSTTITIYLSAAISTAPSAGSAVRKGSGNNFRPISGADQGSESATENYVANAVVGTTSAAPSYKFEPLPTSEPGSQNIYPTDEGSSMALSTTSDDVIMFALFCNIALTETTGTYKGTDSGYENQLSLKYTYS